MELKQYIRIIREEKRLITTLALLTALAAAAFCRLTPVRYETSVSLFLERQGTQATDQFKYDGYYAYQAQDLLASSVEKMLMSPQVVEDIYRRSGVDPQLGSLRDYKKQFTAHKLSGQYVEVTFSSRSRADAGKIAIALGETVNERLTEEKNASAEEVSFAVAGKAPVILEKRADERTGLALGLVSGLALGVFAAFFKRYLS